jgi:hypothetical protein
MEAAAVDWLAAADEIGPIDRNRQALKRLVLMLFGMAEMGFGRPRTGGDSLLNSAERRDVSGLMQAELSKLSPALTLPRHLYRAILLLLRPAESAVRRLVIAAAQDIVVTLPPFRPRKPKPRISDTVAAMRRLGLAVNLSKEDFARYEAERKAAERRAARPRGQNLPLIDALKRSFRIRRHYVPDHAAPRIMGLCDDSPYRPLPPPPPSPSPNDPIGAARLMLRLEALGRVLDDLPKQAQRFALWRARNNAAHQRVKGGIEPWRPRRVGALRGGRPPGGRLKCYDPDARRRKNTREIDEILAHCHSMALYALDRMRRDSS